MRSIMANYVPNVLMSISRIRRIIKIKKNQQNQQNQQNPHNQQKQQNQQNQQKVRKSSVLHTSLMSFVYMLVVKHSNCVFVFGRLKNGVRKAELRGKPREVES